MDLSQATPSTNDGPTRVGMHSVEGFGKTTFLAHWPSPIIVGVERGIPRDLGFSVDTITPRSWPDVFDIVSQLRRTKHSYGTVGFDTMDWLEPLIYQFVCDRDSKRQTEMNPKGRLLESIEDYGFGKGYLVAEEEFRKLIAELDILQAERGMHVVMLMHSHVKTFKNPTGPDFDRWEPKCQARIARVIVEYVEHMLFGFFQVTASKEGEDKERYKMSPDKARAKGISSGVRLIGAQQNAMYDAKNRIALNAEFEYGHPDDLIKTLLGGDLSAEQRASSPRARGPETEPRQQREPDVKFNPAQEFADQPQDERNPNGGGTYRRSPAGDGVPAHHESRAADEARRREETFQRTREGNARTEQAQREQRDNGPIDGGQRHLEEADRRVSKGPLDQALELALKVRGDKYRTKIDGWVTKAAGDPAKLQSIINQVNSDCAQPTQGR